MKPLRMPSKKNGTVLVDFIVASSLAMLASGSIIWLVLHLWVYNFVNTEAFYLARAGLYGNTYVCQPSESLVSKIWVYRKYFCSGGSVNSQYTIFPELFRSSNDQPEVMRQTPRFTVHLER